MSKNTTLSICPGYVLYRVNKIYLKVLFSHLQYNRAEISKMNAGPDIQLLIILSLKKF